MTDKPDIRIPTSLGKRYSSEDMYRNYPQLGDPIAVECGGVLYTDTIRSVEVTGAVPTVYPKLSRLQRIVRRLTPARWRKPLQPIHPGMASRVIINGEDVGPLNRAYTTIQGMAALAQKISEGDEPR